MVNPYRIDVDPLPRPPDCRSLPKQRGIGGAPIVVDGDIGLPSIVVVEEDTRWRRHIATGGCR